MPENREPRWRWRRRRTSRQLSAPREALAVLDAKIRPDFKRAVAGTVLALILLAVAVQAGGLHHGGRARLITLSAGLGFLIIGVIAVRSTAREVGRIAHVRASGAAGSGLYILISVVGYVVVLLGILQILDVRLGSLLVGGAVTGVVLGIAAQQSLGNFFAGLVLLFSRPFIAGDRIKIFSGALGGPFEGVITGSGLIYTTILTDAGPINLPNAGLLGSAIGPAPVTEPDLEQASAAQDGGAASDAPDGGAAANAPAGGAPDGGAPDGGAAALAGAAVIADAQAKTSPPN